VKYREADAKVREQVAALEVAEGYPTRPERIGAEFVRLGLVPAQYAPGAVGWTDKLADIVVLGGGDVECEVPDAILAKHAGKEVVVDGKTVKIDVKSKVADGGTKPDAVPKGGAR
jgi:hypothetical protein